MKTFWISAVLFLCALFFFTDAAVSRGRAEYSRQNPITEAVQKTCASIVTIKVVRGESDDPGREIVGTGVIVDERGYIITNHHLIATAARIHVCLTEGAVLPGVVVADEPNTDLAILLVRAPKSLQALPLGPGSDLLVGETVIAIGHPFGYTQTVSTGIISALGREIRMPSGDVLLNLIQTNASINPGNSGGPLLNINGELIGINAAIREGAQGIAFAINADTVKEMLSRQLSVQRLAGVSHGLLCWENVATTGANRQRVVVHEVGEQTPAESAGIQRGDEIVRVAGRPVVNRFDVERSLWDHRPGEMVDVKLVRQGKTMIIALTLAAGSYNDRITASNSPPRETGHGTPDAELGQSASHRR